MKAHRKLLAVLGAAALTFGTVGIALATDLLEGQVGTALGEKVNEEACADFPLEIGPGEIGVHFVLNQPEADSGNLFAEFSNPASSVGPVANSASEANVLHFYIVIPGDGDTVIESAYTDVDGNNLVVSHACPGETTTTTTTTTTEETTTTTTEETTTTTTFTQETSGETDVPTEPPTTTFGGGTSGPADGSWLLVLALGIFLASVVILTPARAKSGR